MISRFRLNLTAKNYVRLSWDKNPYATGYRIYRTKKKTGNYKLIQTMTGASGGFTDKTVKKNKKYYYWMEAFRTLDSGVVTGGRTNAKFIQIPAFKAPKIVIRKGKIQKIRFITIRLKRYKGKYVEIYAAQGGRRFKKVKLVSSKISRYKKGFKIQYRIKNKDLGIRIRTFDKKKKKKYYSSFSKTVNIRV